MHIFNIGIQVPSIQILYTNHIVVLDVYHKLKIYIKRFVRPSILFGSL